MFPLQNTKSVAVVKPASIASNATSTGIIDTLGYEECKVSVLLDSAASTTNNPSALNLQEADTTDASNFSTISGFEGDTDFTIPAVSATLPTTIDMDVDCRARKRYLRVQLTPGGAAMICGVTAVLGKAKESPSASVAVG